MCRAPSPKPSCAAPTVRQRAEGHSLPPHRHGEPLSVAIHGVRRAGDLMGKKVLIAGAGPIGMLLAIAAGVWRELYRHLRYRGRAPAPCPRGGSGRGHQRGNLAGATGRYEADKGFFDAALEGPGVTSALAALFKVVRPGRRVVLLGMMPARRCGRARHMLMAREIDFVGAFRFSGEFDTAVELAGARPRGCGAVMSADLPMSRLNEAFQLAGDAAAPSRCTCISDAGTRSFPCSQRYGHVHAQRGL